jgi:hypothetical protein
VRTSLSIGPKSSSSTSLKTMPQREEQTAKQFASTRTRSSRRSSSGRVNGRKRSPHGGANRADTRG